MDMKISAAIDEAVERGTFSLQAVEGIKALREENTKLAEQVAAMARDAEAKRKERVELDVMNTSYREGLEGWEARENGLKAREEAVHKGEIAIAEARAKAMALEFAFGTVFRNVTVRETVNRSVPVSQPGGYTNMMNETATTTRDAD